MPITDPKLLEQWDQEKNGGLTPADVTPGSHRRVWWRCGKGHSWQTEVKTRAQLGCGCPVCSGKVALPGETDLATLYPELAGQWHPEKNGTLTPQDVRPASHRKVWWQCGKGHVWQAIVSARTAGEGCPVCAGKIVVPGVNDLASRFPEIAEQWDVERNGGRTAAEAAAFSNQKVWWRCEKGHSWQASISPRSREGYGCPYCSGRRVLKGYNDLATVEPFLARQWHPTLNGDLTPEQVTAGSRREVWWQCSLGHVWKARVHSRAGKQRSGCPVCAGRTRAASRDPPALADSRGPPALAG